MILLSDMIGREDRIIMDAYRGKTILISGAMGYIGSALTQALADMDCKIMLLDQSDSNTWRPKGRRAEVSVFYGDVSRREIWESMLLGVDYIFHLAALEYDRKAFDITRDIRVNAISVAHILEVCRERGFYPKIIFSSSANLFGLVDAVPVNEKYYSHPASLWSAHKLLAENYLSIYAKKYNIKSVILRLTNVYGPSVNQHSIANVVINKVIADALAGRKLTLYANRDCMRDYILIDDVVKAFLYAGAEDRLSTDGSFYVIGSEEGRTIADVWQLIADNIKVLTGRDVPIEFDGLTKLEPFDMRNFVADAREFQKKTGWKAKVSLREGIKLTTEFLLSKESGKT